MVKLKCVHPYTNASIHLNKKYVLFMLVNGECTCTRMFGRMWMYECMDVHVWAQYATYFQPMVGVSQAQLPAHYHGLLGAPAVSTQQPPALGPVGERLEHLHAPLVPGPPPSDTHLCRAEGSCQWISSQTSMRSRRISLDVGKARWEL